MGLAELKYSKLKDVCARISYWNDWLHFSQNGGKTIPELKDRILVVLRINERKFYK